MTRIGIVHSKPTARTRQLGCLSGALLTVEPGGADALIWAEPARRTLPYPPSPLNVADLPFWPDAWWARCGGRHGGGRWQSPAVAPASHSWGPRPSAASGPPRSRQPGSQRPSWSSLLCRSRSRRRPFGAIHRAGAIAGYAILCGGKIIFRTRAMGASDPDPAFDVLWVHRAVDRRRLLLLRLLDRPFGYDIDDNVLAVPEYRERFGRVSQDTVQALVRQATGLSASTERLVSLLQSARGVRLADRLVITPNLALTQPAAIEPGLPRAVVWVSSDIPALTGTREAVELAARDFCAAHRLRLVCMGATPSGTLRDAGFPLEHVGVLPHGAYLESLRSLSPAILVYPLEPAVLPGTQDFIDGKSDVKMLDAAAVGLVGVYSPTKPYTDSNLGSHILCENTNAGWLDGLRRAYRACARPGIPPVSLARPVLTEAGLLPFADAPTRIRLPTPLFWSKVKATLDYGAQCRERFIEEADIDMAFYLAALVDVKSAVRDGHVASAGDHYQRFGHGEGRSARTLSEIPEPTQPWWAELIQSIDRLEQVTDTRALVIERLLQQQAARRALR